MTGSTMPPSSPAGKTFPLLIVELARRRGIDTSHPLVYHDRTDPSPYSFGAYVDCGGLGGTTIDSDGDTDVDVTTEYTYDDSGIRVRQVVEQVGQATSVTEFVVDHQNATAYAQTIEEHSREDTTHTRQVSYTIGLDEIVQAVKDNPAATAVVSQFLHDGRGSVRQLADAVAELVQAATKDAASVLKLDYSAYGTAVNYAAETVATALLHNGEFVDPVTRQQYLRARWYDQSSGRFNRVDPFAGEASIPQSLHKYLFAHGDAVSHVDPGGEVLHYVLSALFGGLALGGTFALWEAAAGGSMQQVWSAGFYGLGAGVAFGGSWQLKGLFNSRKQFFAGTLTGLVYAAVHIIASRAIKASLPPPSEVVLQFTNGFSDGLISEFVDQANPFRKGSTSSIVVQTFYAPMWNALSSVSASLLARQPIDWSMVGTRFVVDSIASFFAQAEFSEALLTAAMRPFGDIPPDVVKQIMATYANRSEYMTTIIGSLIGALAGQL